jgi:hypothetical protein
LKLYILEFDTWTISKDAVELKDGRYETNKQERNV